MMKPSKKKSKKRKKSSPAAATGSPREAVASGASSSPQTETLTLTQAAAAVSETESTSGGDTSTSASTSSVIASSFSSTFSSSTSTASSSTAGDDLAWLFDAFASASIDQVDSAYRAAGGDPFLAAGILGSSLEPQTPPPPPDLSPRAGSGGRKTARRPKRVAVAATGMVTDVIGKGYTRQVVSPVSESKAWKGRYGEAEGGGGGGRRYSVDEAEQFLGSMLGDNTELGMGVVRDVLGQYGYDIEKALDALLDISDSSSLQNIERYFPNAEWYGVHCPKVFHGNGVSKKNTVKDKNRGSYQLTDETPGQTYHNSGREHDFLWGDLDRSHMQAVRNPEMTHSTISPSRSTMVKPNAQQLILESLFRIPEVRTYEPNTMDWKKVVKKLQSFNSPIIPNNQERPNNGDDYEEFRGVATRFYDTMKAYYQKAALAYAKGELSYASYLAEEGKHYRELARKEDEKASREIFEARNKHITNTVTIDLHGQHVRQAIRLLKVHMLVCVCMPSVLLRVITGCGVEGTGKGKIKQAVIELVDKERIEWHEENSGTIVLRLGGPREYGFSEHDSDSD